MPPQPAKPPGQTNPSLSPFDRPPSAASNTSNPKPPTPTPSTQPVPGAVPKDSPAAAPKPGESAAGGPARASYSTYPAMAWSPYQWDRKIFRERELARQDAEKERAAASSAASTSAANESSPASGDPAGANRAGAAPHHHHHHHHHVHNHASQSPSASAATPTNGAPAPATQQLASTATPPSTSAVRRPESTGVSLGPRWGSGYPFFAPREADRIAERNFKDAQKEREARALREREKERDFERQRQERQEKERERLRELEAERERRRKAEAQTSPKVGQNSGGRPGFFMPTLPPSPTVSRSLPAPNSQPGSANRTAASPQNTPSTAGTRPNLPLPGISSLGNRSLPSPFDRDRAPSTSSTDAPGQPSHNRTLSNSSNKDRLTSGLSPGKPAGRLDYASGDPNQRRPGEPERSPMASPTATTKNPSTASATGAAGAGAGPARQFSTYGYSAPFLGGFGGSNYSTFSSSWLDRERQRQREREIRERELREQERRRELEREKLNKERLERDEQQRKLSSLDTRPFASRTSALYGGDPYRAQFERLGQPSTSNQSRIEVLNAPVSEQPSQPHTASSTLNQVAPNREPRPYTYAGKTEPLSANASLKEREYHYTPRDKKSRMDAAMEEQAYRRGSLTKKRREDRPRSPPLRPLPYLSNLTREIKVYPEVTSTQIETWLKTLPDLTAIRSRHVYGGNGWSMAGNLPENAQLGDLMIVRINSTFLGEFWILRGEDGWDSADTLPAGDVQIASGRSDRNVFGTDVYTDDSDLGLVLLHAGWLRWKRRDGIEVEKVEPELETKVKQDDRDNVLVSVRLVPRLVRYFATERNGIATRGWGNGHDGLSIVVEGIQRQKPTRKIANSRANRKLRMAEVAQQRAAIFGLPRPLEEDERRINGVLPSVVFIDSLPLIKYNPHDLLDYLDTPDPDDRTARNLWTHDLHMESEEDIYIVALSDSSNPPNGTSVNVKHLERLLSSLKQNEKAETWTDIAEGRSGDDLSWDDDGLLVRLEGDAGVFCAVKAYRWAKREGGPLIQESTPVAMDTTE